MTILFMVSRYFDIQQMLNTQAMSRKTEIEIGGHWLTEQQVKVIALFSTGITGTQICEVLSMAPGTLHNYCNFLYQLLHLPHCHTAIGIWGIFHGFNHRAFWEGKDVLNTNERERFYQEMPHLENDKREIKVIIIHPK